MQTKEQQKLQSDLDIVNQKIDDIKLDDKPDFKLLKELIQEREKLEFRLQM